MFFFFFLELKLLFPFFIRLSVFVLKNHRRRGRVRGGRSHKCQREKIRFTHMRTRMLTIQHLHSADIDIIL